MQGSYGRGSEATMGLGKSFWIISVITQNGGGSEPSDPPGNGHFGVGACLRKGHGFLQPILLSTATAPEQTPAPPRPYQGVRVKEPVKELLRRKRGHASSGAPVTPTAVRRPPVASGGQRGQPAGSTRGATHWEQESSKCHGDCP